MSKTSILLTSILITLSSYILAQTDENSFNIQALKINRVLYYMDQLYVDSINTEAAVEVGIKKMLEYLDPHSSYISAKDVQAITEQLDGEFEGIGIQYSIYKDTLLIVGIIPGGPSDKGGLKAGDRILSVNNENITNIELTDLGVTSRLKGEKNSKVNLKIKRKNNLLDFIITRDIIPITSIDAAYKIDEKTSFMRINRFSKTTYNEFIDKLDELGETENIIIDLRGNVGGYLEIATRILSEMLSKGKLLVYTEGLHSEKKEYRVDADEGKLLKSKIVVLIDEGTASASEIVSGALQDWDRAVIIGRRSFGKGLVQNAYLLPDGSVLRLTTSKYYTPSGRLIQKPYKGIKTKYSDDVNNRYKSGELSDIHNFDIDSTREHKTLESKRLVYGGGGILPDIFIPLYTSSYSNFYREALNKGIINDYLIEFVDKNRDNIINKYKSSSDYIDRYIITDNFFDKFVEYARKHNIKCTESDYNTSNKALKILFKALIARDIWDTSAYFKILNTTSHEFNKALEILNNNKYSQLLYPN